MRAAIAALRRNGGGAIIDTVRTPMSEEEGDASVDVTPFRRRAEPEEISAAVAFLASDDAIYITGAELAVDGGYLAR
jgi:3alpha(or 20beta)-hydroxysteroid dehydrogenase